MAWGRKSQSAQSREISPLWLLKCGLRGSPEIVKIGNFSYKFGKKGYAPLSNFFTKFGWGEEVPGTHPYAKFYRFGFINVGLQPEKSLKLGISP